VAERPPQDPAASTQHLKKRFWFQRRPHLNLFFSSRGVERFGVLVAMSLETAGSRFSPYGRAGVLLLHKTLNILMSGCGQSLLAGCNPCHISHFLGDNLHLLLPHILDLRNDSTAGTPCTAVFGVLRCSPSSRLCFVSLGDPVWVSHSPVIPL
jgi:hypothetical protein